MLQYAQIRNYRKEVKPFGRLNTVSTLVLLRFQCSRCHELSDENNTFLSFAWSLPGVIEADNVRMLETLQHPGLLFEALTLRLGQLAILNVGEKE